MRLRVNSTDILIEECSGVYPVAEDSILLMNSIANLDFEGKRVLDMGTGTGVIAIYCAKRKARVVASDICQKALECARRNAALNGVRIEFVESNLFSNIKGCFDIIIFNPPYLPFDGVHDESDHLVIGGYSGGELIVEFLRDAKSHLSPNAVIYIVLSSLGSNRVLGAMKKYYRFSLVLKQRFFFEKIETYKLTRA